MRSPHLLHPKLAVNFALAKFGAVDQTIFVEILLCG